MNNTSDTLTNNQNQYTRNSQSPVKSNIKVLLNETKLNELETKIIILEQNNNNLVDQIRSYERNFEMQLHKINQVTEMEKDSRLKTERYLATLTDQSSISSNELKNRMALMQEIIEKEEKWKYQQREKDIELYKNLISRLTEKVSETVRLEIEARFKADLDNKSLTQSIAQKVMKEVDVVRKEMDDMTRDYKDNIKENSKECSERSHALSRYVDQVIEGRMDGPSKTNEQLKNFVSRLTDQVKSNIQIQNEQNKIFEEKIANLEGISSTTKEEIYKVVLSSEERLVKKVKDFKLYMETMVRNNIQNVNERIDSFSSKVDRNLNLLSTQLTDTRQKLTVRLSRFERFSKDQYKAIVEDLEITLDRIYKYEDLLEQYNKWNKDTKDKIDVNLAELESKVEIWQVNVKF